MPFIFVQNLVTFDCEIPFQLTPHFTLRRADARQMAMIREKLESMQSVFMMGYPPYGLNFQKMAAIAPDDKRVIVTAGPPIDGPIQVPSSRSDADWLFWVVTYDGLNDEDETLAFALMLLRDEINLGFNFGEQMFGMHAAALFQFYQNYRNSVTNTPRTVRGVELGTVNALFTRIEEAEKKRLPAWFALRNFWDLASLPSYSNHEVLGYFAVIESLLTHNPNDKEIGDSLTHQLRTKLTLLERFFVRPLDFGPFGVKPEAIKEKKRIWSALYEFRSYIAHGKRFDFNVDFPMLKSRDATLEFLREVTKLVILVALERPEFMEDLKAV